MKKQCIELIDSQSNEILELSKRLFETPELGFKEHKTKALIQDFLKKEGFTISKEYFETGFEITIGSGKPHIGLICELDAIPTQGHRCADPVDHAAHSCGHSTQVGIMLSAITALKKLDAVKNGGTITLFFTPAEEFCDLAYRKELQKAGKIKTLSGKTNMLLAGCFDDIDLCIHMHGMGEYRGYKFSVDSTLAGFLYKEYNFIGKASHAAVCPDQGVNALNAFALFQSAVGMLRETFVDEDKNRVHGMITKGGDTVNSIPSHVVYEGYVRSFNTLKLQSISDQLTHTAKHCAQALNGECEVHDMPGYLPFHQNHDLNKVIYKNMLEFTAEDQILTDEKSVAAGDIGDLGCFIPTIQFGYTGFKGTMHGKDLEVISEQEVYIEPAKIVAMSVLDLLQDPSLVDNIKKNFKPEMTMEEYKQYVGITD